MKKIIPIICFIILVYITCSCTNQKKHLQNEESTVVTTESESVSELEPIDDVSWESEYFDMRFNGTGKCSFIDGDKNLPIKFVDKINADGNIYMMAKSNTDDSVAVAFTVEYLLPDDLSKDIIDKMAESVILDIFAKGNSDSAKKAKLSIGDRKINAVKIDLEEEGYTEIICFEYKNDKAYCILFANPTETTNTLMSLFKAY